MTEYQILANFWMQAISSAMFQLGVFVLLWAALRGSLRIYDQGANLFTKIISSLFGLGVVYSGLQVSAFFSINWQSASYSLGQMENLSSHAQRFADFLPVSEPPEFSLIPWDPITGVWWIVVVIALLGPIWTKK